MSNRNSPIRVTASKESRERVFVGLMAFHRWARSRNLSTPSALVEGLRDYGLEMSIANLQLDDTFHLVKLTRHDSSRAVQILAFNASESDLIRVRYVKKSDNDRHALNLRTGEVRSLCGHWMSGDSEYHSVMAVPAVSSARELLLEHWIAPQKWCRDGRLVLVRPEDLPPTLANPENNPGISYDADIPKVRGVSLCKTAVTTLKAGFTLLLVKGDLIQVQLPREKVHTMLIAGLVFKEGQPQPPSVAVTAAPRKRQRRPERPDGLGFIIPEMAQRNKRFTGIHKDYINSAGTGERFIDGMYEWGSHDVFRYIAGRWE